MGRTESGLKCLAGRKNMCEPGADCFQCGFGPDEAARRKKTFKKSGLTLCDDGLWRFLIPPRNDGPAVCTIFKED